MIPAANKHVPTAAVGLLVLLLGGCNSLLGIHAPREGDASTMISGPDAREADATSLTDARPEAGPDDHADAPSDEAPAEAGLDTPPDLAPDVPEAGPPDVPDASANDDGMDEPGDLAPPHDADTTTPDAQDGPTGDATPPVIDIVTAGLPDALYNIAYVAQLAATGGGGTDYLWRVSSGRLPVGVDLDGAGKLAGVPRESGPFVFEVTVSDRVGGSGKRRLTLNVVRKHWLAFRSNTNSDDYSLFGLYAVDVRSPTVKLTISSNLRAGSGSVGKFEFSPDGAYVAFVGEAVPSVPQLYVVDMRGDLPDAPRKVNEFGLVRDFAWSPDSRNIAYPVEGDQTLDVVISDVTLPDAAGDRMGNPPQNVSALGFVTPSLLTYFSETIAFSRRNTAGHFNAPSNLLTPGALVQVWPELESALFASFGESCMDPTWTLADFGSPIMTRTFEGYVAASPNRDFVAHRDKGDLRYRVYATWSDQAIAEFPTDARFCSPGSWSGDGRMFATADNDGKLLVTRIQGTTATTTTVAGTYGKLAEHTPPRFSPGDRWLAFSTDDGAYVITNDGGTFGSPVGGGMAVSAPFGQPRIRFSPDGLLLATGESASMGRKADVTIVDLRKAAPTTSRLSFPSSYEGSSVFDLGWSAHATELAVLLQDGAYPAVTNVYLVSADGPNKGSTLNLSGFSGCSGYPCRSVTAFRFQP